MASPARTSLQLAGDIQRCHEYGTVPYHCSQSSLRLVSHDSCGGQYGRALSREPVSALQSQKGAAEDSVLPPQAVQGATYPMWYSRPGDPVETYMYSRAEEFAPQLPNVSEGFQQTKSSDVWTTSDTDCDLPKLGLPSGQNGAFVSKPTGCRGSAPEMQAIEYSSNIVGGTVVLDQDKTVPGGSWNAMGTSARPAHGLSYLGLDRGSGVPTDFPVAATDIAPVQPARRTPQSTQEQVLLQTRQDTLSKVPPEYSSGTTPPTAIDQSTRPPCILRPINGSAHGLTLAVGQMEPPRYGVFLEEVAATVPAIVQFSFDSLEFIGKPARAVGNRIFISVYIEEAEEGLLPCRTESVTVDPEGFADFAGAGVQLPWRGEEFVHMKVYKENGNDSDEVIGHVKMQFESMHPGGAAMKVLTIGNQNEGNGYLILRLSLLPVTQDPSHHVAQRISSLPQQPVSGNTNSACDGGFSTSEPTVCSSHAVLRPRPSEETYSTTAAAHSPILHNDNISSFQATSETGVPSLSIVCQSPLRAQSKVSVPTQQHQLMASLQGAHLSIGEDPPPSLEIAVSPTILKGFSAVGHVARSADEASPQGRGHNAPRRKPIVPEKRKPFARFARWWCCDMNAGPDLN